MSGGPGPVRGLWSGRSGFPRRGGRTRAADRPAAGLRPRILPVPTGHACRLPFCELYLSRSACGLWPRRFGLDLTGERLTVANLSSQSRFPGAPRSRGVTRWRELVSSCVCCWSHSASACARRVTVQDGELCGVAREREGVGTGVCVCEARTFRQGKVCTCLPSFLRSPEAAACTCRRSWEVLCTRKPGVPKPC